MESLPLFLYNHQCGQNDLLENQAHSIFLQSHTFLFLNKSPQIFWIVFTEIAEEEIICVIAPGSDSTTAVLRMQSKILVFPWSTFPITTTKGCLSIILHK